MRKPRVLERGAIYHVASKIDHKAMSLQDPNIKQIFLDVVKIAKQKFPFKLWNFTVMDNHFHFLIQPEDGVSLSKIMQWIKCMFAKKWNKIHHTDGHVWGDRFFSKIVSTERQFEQTSEYIDNNPVRVQLVREAKNWKFGGLFHRLMGIVGLIDKPLNTESLFKTSPPCIPNL
jgi:REP element-mobilizing transposase RayT